MEKGCFKGCLGCFGCGCLMFILAIVVPSCWFVYWCNTDGRIYLADGIQKVTNESCKYAFEEESAAEIASITKEIRDDLANSKLGFIDSFNYVFDNIKDDKLQSQLIFAVIYRNLTGKIKDKKGSALFVDEEGAEATRTIMYALSQNKVDANNATSQVTQLLEKKNRTKNGYNVEDSFETKKVKNDITKEDMEKVSNALKKYVKDNNLEKPDASITPDALAKEEVIKFLNGLKNLNKK